MGITESLVRSGLERWLLYFSGLEESKMPEAVLADAAIKDALKAERYFAMDKKERLAYYHIQGVNGCGEQRRNDPPFLT